MDIRTDTETSDIEAIEQIVSTVERAQRAKDVEGFLALFHPDALWTTAHGKVRPELVPADAFGPGSSAVVAGPRTLTGVTHLTAG